MNPERPYPSEITESESTPSPEATEIKKNESRIELVITEKPEDTGRVVAEAMLEEIKQATPEHPVKIGVSGGSSQDRVSRALIQLLNEAQEQGQNIDLSNVLFIQTEVAWPENPDSPSNVLGNQIKAGLEIPLRGLGYNPQFYYAGTEPSWEEAQQNFEEKTKDMDFLVATFHESGAAKGIRDADDVTVTDETGTHTEPRYTQGLMKTRHIHARVFDEISKVDPKDIELGGRVFDRPPKDKPAYQTFNGYRDYITQQKENDPSAEIPYGYISEGYWSYARAKRCYMIAEGENKSEGLRRIFKHIRTRSMDEETKKTTMDERKADTEGITSGQTVLELREQYAPEGTVVVVDKSTTSLLNVEELGHKGIEIHTAQEPIEEQNA
jgi:hypothetical protein